jgi:fatty-acid desaturase
MHDCPRYRSIISVSILFLKILKLSEKYFEGNVVCYRLAGFNSIGREIKISCTFCVERLGHKFGHGSFQILRNIKYLGVYQ